MKKQVEFLTLKKYKHVIWDWNGTLLDDLWLSLETINGILEKRKLPQLTIEKYREVFDFPIFDYYLKLGFNFELESFETLANEYVAEYDRRSYECNLHINALDILRSLAELEISQSILSASHQITLLPFVKNYGIAHYFNKIIGLDNHYAESKIENGKRWIKELDYNPGEVLLFGDTVHDYQVAKAMGIDCLLVAAGHQNLERLKQCRVEVVSSLSDILAMLKLDYKLELTG